ncbi:MAG: hypothetical protein ABIQ31_06175 [Ferruginibacter sp.]
MYRRIFFVTSATRPGNQPDKVIHNDKDDGVPLFFALHNERIRNGSRDRIYDNQVYISWQTDNEINTSHFELQRSENGKDFKVIETIAANGFSKIISRYATTDSNFRFCFDLLHYRLKVVLKDGKENFTDVITFDPTNIPEASVHDLTYSRNQLLDKN